MYMDNNQNEPSRSEAETPRQSQESDYYILIGDEQQGPYTLRELKAMWMRGELKGDTLYARPGMPEWETVSKIQRELLLCELPTEEPGLPLRGTTPTLASGSAPETKSREASPAPKAEPAPESQKCSTFYLLLEGKEQ